VEKATEQFPAKYPKPTNVTYKLILHRVGEIIRVPNPNIDAPVARGKLGNRQLEQSYSKTKHQTHNYLHSNIYTLQTLLAVTVYYREEADICCVLNEIDSDDASSNKILR
jgi:hypothetical protein